MAQFKVVWDIELDAESPLEAAKEAQRWMQDSDANWQFYVQEEGKSEIFNIDLEEEDEDAVLPVENYEPLIK
jgi:hypothetical protein